MNTIDRFKRSRNIFKAQAGLDFKKVYSTIYGKNYDDLNGELKARWEKAYKKNTELINKEYQRKKELEYNKAFENPTYKEPSIDISLYASDYTFEPLQTPLQISTRAGSNSLKWSYQRLQAANLFGRSDLNTTEGVARFLAAHGLDVDGMLGQNTLKALNLLYNKNINLNQIRYKPPVKLKTVSTNLKPVSSPLQNPIKQTNLKTSLTKQTTNLKTTLKQTTVQTTLRSNPTLKSAGNNSIEQEIINGTPYYIYYNLGGVRYGVNSLTGKWEKIPEEMTLRVSPSSQFSFRQEPRYNIIGKPIL